MDNEGNNQSQTKREEFRKQIRRKQIEQFFATKRKLANDFMSKHEEKPFNERDVNLNDLFEGIKTMINLDEKLTKLGNFLYQPDCLPKTAQWLGQKKMRQLCMKITNTIFNVILPHFCLRTEQDLNNRQKCLTIVSNIVADELAPHSELVTIISQGINSNYSDFTQIISQQVAELGWIIANTLCHKLDLSSESDLEKPIEYILQMAEQVLLIPNPEMISTIYKSLTKFYRYVDTFFGNNDNKKIEHFKIQRLILLERSIQFNLNAELGTVVLLVIGFIDANIIYLDHCGQNIYTDICEKCFKILSCTSSDKIMTGTFNLVKKIAKTRQIVVLIVKDYFTIIQNCLMYQGATIKLQALRLLLYLCIDTQITTFMANQKQLELILTQLIKHVRDTDTLMQLMVVTKAIVTQTDRKCGMNALGAIEEYLCHKTGVVGQYASDLIEELGEDLKSAML